MAKPDCRECGGSGWITKTTSVKGVEYSGAARCCCSPVEKQQAAPQLSLDQLAKLSAVAARASEELAAISFYPREPAARKVIARALVRMASSPEQIYWTVQTSVSLFRSWEKCGEAGLRQVFCSRWVPRDGLSNTYTEAYPEGVPIKDGEVQMELLETTELPSLPEGARATADRDLDRMVVEAEKAKRLGARGAA